MDVLENTPKDAAAAAVEDDWRNRRRFSCDMVRIRLMMYFKFGENLFVLGRITVRSQSMLTIVTASTGPRLMP